MNLQRHIYSTPTHIFNPLPLQYTEYLLTYVCAHSGFTHEWSTRAKRTLRKRAEYICIYGQRSFNKSFARSLSSLYTQPTQSDATSLCHSRVSSLCLACVSLMCQQVSFSIMFMFISYREYLHCVGCCGGASAKLIATNLYRRRLNIAHDSSVFCARELSEFSTVLLFVCFVRGLPKYGQFFVQCLILCDQRSRILIQRVLDWCVYDLRICSGDKQKRLFGCVMTNKHHRKWIHKTCSDWSIPD